MSWAGAITTHTGITEAAKTPYVLQLAKELHRVFITRTDSPLTQVCYIRIWGSLDGLKETSSWTEQRVMAVGVSKIEFPLVGYRYFAIQPNTPLGADNAVIDVDLIGDGGEGGA